MEHGVEDFAFAKYVPLERMRVRIRSALSQIILEKQLVSDNAIFQRFQQKFGKGELKDDTDDDVDVRILPAFLYALILSALPLIYRPLMVFHGHATLAPYASSCW